MLSLFLPANEVRGKVMFLYLSVILFTGGCLPHCMLGYTPGRHSQADTPHWADTPWEDTPWQKVLSWADTSPPWILQDAINKRAVHILLECILVHSLFPANAQHHYRRQMKFAKVMFLHMSVILSTGGSTWVGTPHPPGRYTPRQVHPQAGTPLGRYTPWAGTPTPGQVHPPLGRYTP